MSAIPAITAEDVLAVLRELNLPGVYVDFIDVDQPFITQGIDSLDALTIFTQVEEKYGIHIPDDAFNQLESVNDVVTYVNAHFAERAAPGAA